MLIFGAFLNYILDKIWKFQSHLWPWNSMEDREIQRFLEQGVC